MKRGHIQIGDVLVVKDGATTGKVSLVRDDFPFTQAVANEHVFVCRPDGIDPKYLFWFLWSAEGQGRIREHFRGSAQGGITQDFAAATMVPVPPPATQRMIVELVEQMNAEVRSAQRRLAATRSTVGHLRQAVIDAAASGRLTVDWRGVDELKDWQTAELQDVCESIADGDHQAPPRATTGVPFITISAINEGELRLDRATRFVPPEYYKGLKAQRRAKRGDVLFSVTASIAIPALVQTDDQFVFQRHIALLRPDESAVASEYLYYAVGSTDIRRQAHAVATGTAQLTIPLRGLRSLTIDVPPHGEQAEIVRRVERAFRLLDGIELRLAKAQRQIDRAKQAALAKAFRGELSPNAIGGVGADGSTDVAAAE
jgi:type I restriction enzyme S subunit